MDNKENKMGNEKVENRKFVVKVYNSYTGQLAGAVVCVDENEAEQIADEIVEYYIPEGVIGHSIVKTKVEEITENFAGEIWREWVNNVKEIIRYEEIFNENEPIFELNIITDNDYYKGGFHLIKFDYSKLVYAHDEFYNYKFVGWYDVFRDVVIDENENVIGTIDENSEFIPLD